ncbi:hypothetical protein SK37_05034 [Citrobacter sp. MGH109]|nr:hypothetical protein SK37_05034 [Citrobacter sp. MGH109]CAI9394867.1 O-acetyl-ADP-ribose deacetylase [Citrobacter sp. T1.2D-1]
MLTVTQGDITRFNVDAIVNAASTHLHRGGGVGGGDTQGRWPCVIDSLPDIYQATRSYPNGGCRSYPCGPSPLPLCDSYSRPPLAVRAEGPSSG